MDVLHSWRLQKGVGGLVEEEIEVDLFWRLERETVVVLQGEAEVGWFQRLEMGKVCRWKAISVVSRRCRRLDTFLWMQARVSVMIERQRRLRRGFSREREGVLELIFFLHDFLSPSFSYVRRLLVRRKFRTEYVGFILTFNWFSGLYLLLALHKPSLVFPIFENILHLCLPKSFVFETFLIGYFMREYCNVIGPLRTLARSPVYVFIQQRSWHSMCKSRSDLIASW